MWKFIVDAVNDLDSAELSSLDTEAIFGVVPVHSVLSQRPVGLGTFGDESRQLLVPNQFLFACSVISRVADFRYSEAIATWLVYFGETRHLTLTQQQFLTEARVALVRDMLLQLNFHEIQGTFRPVASYVSSQRMRFAVTFAMAHEAAHLLTGDLPALDPDAWARVLSDGRVSVAQWGPELAQDRLALRLCRSAARAFLRNTGQRFTKAAVDDLVLASVAVSLVAVHAIECGYLVGESTSHERALDRLGSLMIEFNPTTAPSAVAVIAALIPVVDTCLFLDPLPRKNWKLFRSLARAGIIGSWTRRVTGVRLLENSTNSDHVLTANVSRSDTNEYLIRTVPGVPAAKCLNLLQQHGRNAVADVLWLLGVKGDGMPDPPGQISRRSLAAIVYGSHYLDSLRYIERRTYVDMWAAVISAAVMERPSRDRMFYHLLEIGEEDE